MTSNVLSNFGPLGGTELPDRVKFLAQTVSDS
jgi:hypothetical protein